MLRLAVEDTSGPAAVRYPRGAEGAYKDGGADSVKRLREGQDFTLVTHGISINTALEAAELLKGDGISVEVIKLGIICPVDVGPIITSVKKTGRLLVLEECCSRGSAGERIAASLSASRVALKSLILLNTGEIFAPCGELDDLRGMYGIDVRGVRQAVISAMSDGRGAREYGE
jgi:1-deoxy-D-xylulose-5-phosphate synthase